MKIQNQCEDFPLVTEFNVSSVSREGTRQQEMLDVLSEHNMEVLLGDRPVLRLTSICQFLPELVLGRLYTDGWIRSISDIDSILITPDGTQAQVLPAQGVSFPERPILRTDPVTPIPWAAEDVFRLADSFAMEMPLHRKTWSTHSCFLSCDGEIRFYCEDIGRHNALDKAIGFGLLQGLDLTRCMIYSSGRMPTDMVMKVIQSGIPIMCAKGAATDKSIALAKRYGLTLICSARRDSFRVLNEGK